MKNLQPSWVALQRLVSELEMNSDMKLVDSMSRRVFEWVYGRACLGGGPIYVQTVVMESNVASPATIHKSLAILEAAGLLSIEVDPTDARRRIVTPTERAHKLIRELSKAVSQWVGQSTSLAKSASRERSPR